VFLNVGTSGERGRFDAAHELGHLVLHGERDAGPAAEREANRFAAAFLLPCGGVLAHLPSAPSVDQILAGKRRWQVAATALTHRLHELGALSEWLYRTTCIELGKRGFRSAEPGGIPRESSQLLHKVFRVLRAERITAADIAADLCLPTEEINGFVFGLIPTVLPGAGDPGPRAAGERPRLRLVR
jgi:Zn-dependent peptidase ImmA (M78 family)